MLDSLVMPQNCVFYRCEIRYYAFVGSQFVRSETAMNQQYSQRRNPVQTTHLRRFLLLSGLGLLGIGLFWTQAKATDTLVIPENPTAAPTAPEPAPQSAPVQPPIVNSTPIKPVTPKPSITRESAAPQVQLSAPKISAPAVQPIPTVTTQGKNSYIDTRNYNSPNPPRYTPPSAVVLTERSSGCQTVAQNGQLLRGNCGAVTLKKPTAKSAHVAAQPLSQRRISLASRRATAPAQLVASRSLGATFQPALARPRSVSPQPLVSVSLQPIERQGLSISLEPIPRYNRAASLYAPTNPQQSNTDLLFPVPIVANITSAFGWRVHPISQSARMHQGTDIGAPMGTPVLAAYAGEVALADWLGGYGMTVVLHHLEGTQASRYAHLSEIFVRAGEWVEKGTVIGRVGSTGYSTGPHLHFEWHHLTEQGWVAVDAGLHLEYAMGNLMRSQQLADAQTKPES